MLCACTPKFDWREVTNSEPAFTVLLPAKSASHTREVNLADIKVHLTMKAADAGHLSFALAYAKVEQQQQKQVLAAMKMGLLKNIRGQEDALAAAQLGKDFFVGVGTGQDGQQLKLVAKFFQRGPWVIQVLILGNEKSFNPELIEMFFGSLKFS